MSCLHLPLAVATLGVTGCAGPRSPAPDAPVSQRPTVGAPADTAGPFTLRTVRPDASKGFTLRYVMPDTSVRYTLRHAIPCGSERTPDGARRAVYCEAIAADGPPGLANRMRTRFGFSPQP